MRKRSGKYLNAREYAERLFMADNYDIQKIASEILEALDAMEDEEIDEIKAAIDAAAENAPATAKSYESKVKWLDDETAALAEVEEKLSEQCPEYTAQIDNGDILDVIDDMIKRLRPVQVYDL
jgi:enolase